MTRPGDGSDLLDQRLTVRLHHVTAQLATAGPDHCDGATRCVSIDSDVPVHRRPTLRWGLLVQTRPSPHPREDATARLRRHCCARIRSSPGQPAARPAHTSQPLRAAQHTVPEDSQPTLRVARRTGQSGIRTPPPHDAYGAGHPRLRGPLQQPTPARVTGQRDACGRLLRAPPCRAVRTATHQAAHAAATTSRERGQPISLADRRVKLSLG